jgi:hypothetical protein
LVPDHSRLRALFSIPPSAPSLNSLCDLCHSLQRTNSGCNNIHRSRGALLLNCGKQAVPKFAQRERTAHPF